MAEESVAKFLYPVLVGQKSKLDQQKTKWLEAVLQLSPIPPLIQSAITLLLCRNCWKLICIHTFTLLLHSFFLFYHPRHYLFTGWNVLAAIVVRRNAARPTFLTPFTKCDQKLFGFQFNIFISTSSVWVTCRFCWSSFSCCLPELCHSSLPNNLLPRFTA